MSDERAPPRAAAKPARSSARSARRRSREFALQGLYEWQLSRAEVRDVDAHVREFDDFAKCDSAYYDALLHGCIERRDELDAVLARHIDRPLAQLSPVEHGVLWIGAYELAHCPEVPYRVAINEAVEVAKAYGGTDGHKYVNGVLDKAAADLRPAEVQSAKRGR